MIIHLKNLNKNFALGLRWLVATRNEIDFLKEKENLSYGFVKNIRQNKKNNYKCAVLTSAEHDKSVSLAGLFSEKYENFIFVHKVDKDLYWVCVIKNHEVWNDLDVGNGTSGDYLCSKDTAEEILQIAKDLFVESEVNIDNIVFVSAQAKEDFPNLAEITLSSVVESSKKFFSSYQIAWLQSHRKKVRRIITFLIIIIVFIVVGSYLYSSQNAAAREKSRILKMEMEQQRAEQERIFFIKNLIYKIDQHQGSRSIKHVLKMVGNLSLESSGWSITNIGYDSSNYSKLLITLVRGTYGDVLSFKKSYSDITVQENIQKDNNEGTKLIDFKAMKAVSNFSKASVDHIETILKKSNNDQRLKLIAYSQRMNLALKTEEPIKNKYGYSSSNFSISGDGLWNIRKLQYVFSEFPTLVVNSINLKTNDENKISWKIEGTIYG